MAKSMLDDWPYPVIGQQCLFKINPMHLAVGLVVDFEIFQEKPHTIVVAWHPLGYHGRAFKELTLTAYAAHNVELIDPRGVRNG